jgi:hypothetical protein
VAAIVTGTNEKPRPTAVTTPGTSTSLQKLPSAETKEKPSIPIAIRIIPPERTRPAPTRPESRPAIVEAIAIPAVIGRKASPASIAE